MALLSPQQRIQLAQRLRQRANTEPKLSARKRQDLRRKASNLVKVNAIEASQQRWPSLDAIEKQRF